MVADSGAGCRFVPRIQRFSAHAEIPTLGWIGEGRFISTSERARWNRNMHNQAKCRPMDDRPGFRTSLDARPSSRLHDRKPDPIAIRFGFPRNIFLPARQKHESPTMFRTGHRAGATPRIPPRAGPTVRPAESRSRGIVQTAAILVQRGVYPRRSPRGLSAAARPHLD